MGFPRGGDVLLVRGFRPRVFLKLTSCPLTSNFSRFKLLIPPTAGAPEGDSGELIRTKALENGVLALPGTAFLPNGTKTPYVRASFSLLEEKEVNEGLRRLAEVIRKEQEA